LDLEPAVHGQLDRFDRNSLENLALSKGTDHALTIGTFGLGTGPFRHMFPDESFGHGLSVGVICIRI
jgi:hypothetical protein